MSLSYKRAAYSERIDPFRKGYDHLIFPPVGSHSLAILSLGHLSQIALHPFGDLKNNTRHGKEQLRISETVLWNGAHHHFTEKTSKRGSIKPTVKHAELKRDCGAEAVLSHPFMDGKAGAR